MSVIDEVAGLFELLGFPIISVSLIVLYRALSEKSKYLEESIKSINDTYHTVIAANDKKSSELEGLIDRQAAQQMHFNDLYLKMISDSSAHADQIDVWRKSEISMLEGQVRKLSNEVERLRALVMHKDSLIEKIQDDCKSLERKINIMNQRGVGPGEAMVMNLK